MDSKLLFIITIAVFLLAFNSSVYAEGSLNGVEEETVDSNGSAIGEMFKGIGVDAQSAKKASIFMSPLAGIVNVVFAVIMGLASLGMFLITSLDLLYITVPPIRNLLNSSTQQPVKGVETAGAKPQSHGAVTTLNSWVSDEAIAALADLTGNQGFTVNTPQATSKRSILFDYVKKRSFFLLLFGVSAVIFSTTIFTDLGYILGIWIMNRLLGAEAAIPQ